MADRRRELSGLPDEHSDWWPDTVALVGLGVVGRGWIPVFGKRALNIRIYDQVPGQAEQAIAWVGAFSAADHCPGVSKIRVCTTLAEALDGARYVQESISEVLENKQSLFRELDPLADPDAILASSTSSLDINDIASGLDGRDRCITVHPFNPPAVLPAVELLPTTQGDHVTVERTVAFLRWLGQTPIRLRRFVPGYVGNRLQLALMREAIALVEGNVVEPADIDCVLSEALALRWAVFGTFGTNHCNADGGIRAYYEKYGSVMRASMGDLSVETPSFDPDMIERYGASVEERFRGVEVTKLSAWRDRMINKIRGVKDADDEVIGGV